MNKFTKIIFLIILILLIISSSFYLKDFRVDASSDTLVAQNDKDFEFFNYYQKIFPNKNNLVIAIETKKKIDEKLLKEIEIISDRISDFPEVSSVFNINKAPILFLNNTKLVDLSSSNYETITKTNFKIDEVLSEFVNSPIYNNQIINNKKNVTAIVIFLEENKKLIDLRNNKNKYLINNTYFEKKSEIDKDRNELINKIRNIINDSSKDYNYFLGGVEMISSDIISFVKKDIVNFSFLVILLVLIILFIIFKNIKWVITILFSSLFAVYMMIGVIGFFNFEVTAISANFLSIMFILSISMNIHILNNYLNSNESLTNTIKYIFWPCFYTFLTTVVAFISLIISDIKPVIDFGIIMVISLFVIIVCAFTVLPFVTSFFQKDNKFIETKFLIINFFYINAIKFKKYILIINFLFLIVAIYGISKLEVENSFIKYFKKNTEIYQGMKLIDKELGGTTPLDVILKFKDNQIEISESEEDNFEEIEFEDDIFSDDLFLDENVWFTEDKINTIKKIHEYLDNLNEVGKVTSIYSLINVANQINKTNLTTFELSVLYNEIPNEYRIDLIDPYLNIDKNMAKISARIKDSDNIKRADLINNINNYTKKSFTNIDEVKVNGLLVLYNNMLSSLFTSQIKSLGFVLLAIFLMFIILFKSIKISIVGIIPNILASTYILGLIGIFNIPLDIMTITIAAISIGIAVDNTIHYLYKYKYLYVNSKDFEYVIKESHTSVGKAVLITSLAISLGFLTLCLSNFVPTMIFGLFTSLAMIFAMIGVLITLPSILYFFR